jgi:DNA-binding beta-propeller fold protein YncE
LDDNKRISVFSNDGVFLNTIASFGTGEGFLADPIDVAVDNSFAVYVLEKDLHRVQKFDRSAEFLKAFDTLENPLSITVDAEAKKVYVLYVGRIQTFDLNGNIIDDFKNEKIGNALDFVKVKNTFYILQGKKLLVISARE